MKTHVLLTILLLSYAPLLALSADNAPPPQPPAEKEEASDAPTAPDAPPPVDRAAEAQVGAGASAPQSPPPAEAERGGGSNDRDEALFDHLKAVVKRLDAANRKGIDFPVKAIESAIRTEFLRRTDGDKSFSWLRRKNLRDADKSVAQDNMDLLLDYSDHLLSARLKKGKAKLKPADAADMKIMAAKAVIDSHNVVKKGRDRSLASLGEHPTGLSQIGKVEAARRKHLVAGLVAGEDYSPVQVKKVDEYGKKLKLLLTASAKEYEKLAAAINQGGGSGSKKAKKRK